MIYKEKKLKIKTDEFKVYMSWSEKSAYATHKNTEKYYTSSHSTDDCRWYFIKSLGGWVYFTSIELTDTKAETLDSGMQNKAYDVYYQYSDTNSEETTAILRSINQEASAEIDIARQDSNSSFMDSINPESLTYEPNLDDYDIGNDVESYLNFKQIKGIFGMPYQYRPEVDRRLINNNDEMEYGRKFTEKVVMPSTLLFLTPGRPQFMAGYSDKYKKQVMQKLYDMGVKNDSFLDGIDDGRYYSFKFAYDEYYTYVNNMIQRAAQIAGLGEHKFDGVPLKRYNWANYKNDNLKTFISGSEYTTFYIEAEPTVNESFGNTTGDSSIASTLNQLSDIGKEVSFLLGAAAGYDLEAAIRTSMTDNLQSFTNFFNKWGGGGAGAVANKIFGGVSTLAMGGHLAFPEIWKDSDYTQSYNVTVKLATPDGDSYSQFINVMVPYYHLLGYILPQALGYNEYTSPFLVRASCGGGFNCEMGIITSMDVTKGPNWNQFKMPLEMTINFTIKDLYKVMAMTNTSSTTEFLKHSQFVDFLANSVGVNINLPEIGRTLSMYKDFSIGGKVNTVKNNISNSMNNFLTNQVSKLKLLW